MSKRPRDKCAIFEVVENDKVVYTGSAWNIHKKYGLKYGNVYGYSERQLKYRRKYLIRFKKYQHYLIEAHNKETNERYVGTANDMAEIFYYRPDYILMRAQRNQTINNGKVNLRTIEAKEEI